MNDLISLEEVNKWVDKLINELELIFSDIREKEVDDSVCGLCEYDCDHGMDGFANECPGFEKDDCFKLKDSIKEEWTDIKNTPTVPAIPISVIEGIKAEIKTAARKHLDIALSITDLSERKEHLKAEEALNYCVSLIDRHIKEYTE